MLLQPGMALTMLDSLHRDVAALEFPFPGAEEYREIRDRVLTQVSSHLIPRLADQDSPAVVVLGGSTGAGKSTLLNSILREQVSAAGVLRPTTRRAVAARNPQTFAQPLSDMAEYAVSEAIPAGMVLVDAPDLDSLERANRTAATRLLETADLWILVTTAARYGDMIPWLQVTRARDRGLQLALVLNRVPDEARTEVRADLIHRLETIGLGESPLFLIPDLGPHEGLLPEDVVSPLREWLSEAIGDAQMRGIVHRTYTGAWGNLAHTLTELLEGVEAQIAEANHLREITLEQLRAPQADVRYAIESGQCAAGTPAARWELAEQLAAKKGMRARSERKAALRRLEEDVEIAVASLLADIVLDASGRIAREWSERSSLMAGYQPGAAEAREVAAAAVAQWRENVREIAAKHHSKLGTEAAAAMLSAAAVGIAGTDVAPEASLEARSRLQEIVRAAIASTAAPYLASLEAVPGQSTAESLRTYIEIVGELE